MFGDRTRRSRWSRTPGSQEFDILEDDGTVYKLVGPVLVKQDLMEAKANVEKRIEFISNNIKEVESRLKELEGKQEKKQTEVSLYRFGGSFMSLSRAVSPQVIKIQQLFQNLQMQAQKA